MEKKRLFKKIDFSTAVVGLTIILVGIVALSAMLFPSSSSNIVPLDVRTEGGRTFSSVRSEDPFEYEEHSSQTEQLEQSLQYEQREGLVVLDVMPYDSFEFNVRYFYDDGGYYVTVNPATDVTREEIYEWFESFSDVDDARNFPIEFVDVWESGPPVGSQ